MTFGFAAMSETLEHTSINSCVIIITIMTNDNAKKLNVYLDNCCFNRPYDSQKQLRVELETKAKLFIQSLVEKGRLDLTISSMVLFENNDNPFPFRKLAINDFLKNATTIVEISDEIQELTSKLIEAVLKKAGMEVLIEKFGNVKAERFISLVIKEPFDYTEWQRNLYADLTADELFDRVKAFERASSTPKTAHS